MNRVSFRLLNPDDLEAYRLLRCFSLQESPFSFSDSIEDELEKNDSDYLEELQLNGNPPAKFLLGAFAGENNLIGFVKFNRDARKKANHKAFIHALYVKPGWREKRIGKALLDQLLNMAKSITGLEQIHLWVLIAENSIIAFYEKSGFEMQGAVVKRDLKIQNRYVDAVYMVNYLNQYEK